MQNTAAISKAPEPTPLRRISTADLMQTTNELIIVHNNQDYRLRITRNGKLILTK